VHDIYILSIEGLEKFLHRRSHIPDMHGEGFLGQEIVEQGYQKIVESNQPWVCHHPKQEKDLHCDDLPLLAEKYY